MSVERGDAQVEAMRRVPLLFRIGLAMALLLGVCGGTARAQTPDPERAALEALYDATGGDDWVNNTNWKSALPVDDWHGVTVSGGKVTRLLLDNNELSGSIPPALGSLTSLPSLWDSKIELSEKFFNEIIRHPVPLDMNTLTALKRSTLGLDLYLWLLPHFRAPYSATPHLAAPVQPVRRTPGQGQRQQHRSSLPLQGFARVEEDQAGLVRPELLDGSWGADPASLDACHRAVGRPTSPRGIAPRGKAR